MWRLPLISMDTWVIFVVKVLIYCLVNVAETFTDIVKQYLLHMNAAKFVICKELP